jgi:hypothetical protein
MALHTKKQFAELCGMKTGNLSNYEARGKVVYSGDYVDDTIEPNKTFLELRLASLSKTGPSTKKEPPPAGEKVTTSAPVVEKAKRPAPAAPKVEPPSESEGGQKGSIYQLTAQKLSSQIDKMSLEMDKLRLQNAKFLGEVVPAGLIKPCIIQHNQSILHQSKITIDKIVREIAKKKQFSADEVAELKKMYTAELNDMMKKATTVTIKALKSIIDDFAAKRSAGERT